MKKITQLSLVFALSFLNALNLEASNWTLKNTFVSPPESWEKPKTADNLRAHMDAKINDLTKEKAEKQAKLADITANLSEKQKDKITLSIKDLDSRLAELNTSKADMDRLANDPNHIYAFSQTDENCVAKRTDNAVIIQAANDALLIHEIRHISLWLQTGRNFQFSKNNLLLPTFADGSIDELISYRAQYAFEPNSLQGHPTDMEHINIEYIGKIQKEDGSFAYPGIRKMWQDDLKIAEQQAKLKQATQGAYTANMAH